MRVWRKVSRIAWTALLGVALLAMTDGHGGVAVGLYRLAVVAGCFWIFARTIK